MIDPVAMVTICRPNLLELIEMFEYEQKANAFDAILLWGTDKKKFLAFQ